MNLKPYYNLRNLVMGFGIGLVFVLIALSANSWQFNPAMLVLVILTTLGFPLMIARNQAISDEEKQEILDQEKERIEASKDNGD